MPEEKPIGAHGGGIPPGWDFPEARKAAEDGLDLWLLDWSLQRTPWQRIQDGANAARFAFMLREGYRVNST
jgi:hypothetical protein